MRLFFQEALGTSESYYPEKSDDHVKNYGIVCVEGSAIEGCLCRF